MQSTGADLKTRRVTELEHPCHFNAHLQNFKAFMKNRFLNKKFREIRSIIDRLEEIDNLSLLEAGYIDRAEKIWKYWISYTRERFPIVFKFAKDNFLSNSFTDNTTNSLKSKKLYISGLLPLTTSKSLSESSITCQSAQRKIGIDIRTVKY